MVHNWKHLHLIGGKITVQFESTLCYNSLGISLSKDSTFIRQKRK